MGVINIFNVLGKPAVSTIIKLIEVVIYNECLYQNKGYILHRNSTFHHEHPTIILAVDVKANARLLVVHVLYSRDRDYIVLYPIQLRTFREVYVMIMVFLKRVTLCKHRRLIEYL